MRIVIQICFVVFLCAIAGGIILIARGCDLTAPRDLHRIERDGIVIFSKDKDKATILAQELKRFIEQIVSQYGHKLRVKRDTAIYIKIFPNRAAFERDSFARTHSEFLYNGGTYNKITREIAIIQESDEDTRKALYHEVTHLLIDAGNPASNFSAWLSEGVAMYFEESSMKGPEPLGGLSKRALDIVKKPDIMPLDNVLLASHAAFQSANNTIYYYQSHLLVYYLLNSEYKDSFFKYFSSEAQTGGNHRGRFEEHFGPINDVEKNFLTFIELKRREREGSSLLNQTRQLGQVGNRPEAGVVTANVHGGFSVEHLFLFE